MFTKTSFKIICLPINWPCADGQKLTTVAPWAGQSQPSTGENNKPPVVVTGSNASGKQQGQDLQNNGSGNSNTDKASSPEAGANNTNANGNGRPAPVPIPTEFLENFESTGGNGTGAEKGKNETIVVVAQPVLPLVPVNGCTGVSCGCTGSSCVPATDCTGGTAGCILPQQPLAVPPAGPNCISGGFPCPIENLNIIDSKSNSSTNVEPGSTTSSGKINVWAIETVETHVKNASVVIVNGDASGGLSPAKEPAPTATTTTTTIQPVDPYPIQSQQQPPVQLVLNQPPPQPPTTSQSKTPVPGPGEFPNTSILPQQQTDDDQQQQQQAFPPLQRPYGGLPGPESDVVTSKAVEPINQSLNIQGPTVQQTSAYQSSLTSNNNDNNVADIQGKTIQQSPTKEISSKDSSPPVVPTNPPSSSTTRAEKTSTTPQTTTTPVLLDDQKSGEGANINLYQSASATPTERTTAPPQFDIQVSTNPVTSTPPTTTTTTSTTSTSTVKPLKIEAKDDGDQQQPPPVFGVPPPDFGNDINAATWNNIITTTAGPTTAGPTTAGLTTAGLTTAGPTTAPTPPYTPQTTLFNPYLPSTSDGVSNQQPQNVEVINVQQPPFTTIFPAVRTTFKPVAGSQQSKSISVHKT